jgi:sulfide:quinone oxidoreductase
VVLVGAGHAHLHLIEDAGALRAAGIDLEVVAPSVFHYSGLAIPVATGAVPPSAGAIDVAALAAAREVPHVPDRVVGIDVPGRRVELAGGGWRPYDTVSFNVGSRVNAPGVAVEDGVLWVKPLASLATLTDRLDALADRWVRAAVVGAGATGLELAGNLALRLGAGGEVVVYDREARPGTDFPTAARRRLVRRLSERGVRFRTAVDVTAVDAHGVAVDGCLEPADLVILATGLQAAPVVADLGLGDARGIPTRATLQHVDHDEIFAVGDCARFLPGELPKLGVYGVRAAPVLAAALVAQHRGEPLPTFHPQPEALRILDLGGGRGVAVRGRLWWDGRSARWLKLAIDRRWLARYR